MSKIRVNSWLSNTQYAVRNTHDEIASTTVKNPLQISPFLQNKPNLLDALMNISTAITMNYEQITMNNELKNKPNSNPIKANTKPIKANFRGKK